MEFNAEKLKYMAVDVVKDYLLHKTPLTSAVAAKAATLELNPDQIKRLIEVSNQVAYLKLLESATDRTFEFPLAIYEDVMTILATPDESMKKEASHKLSPMEIASGKAENDDLEKVAHTDETEDDFGFLKRASKQERIALLNKQLYRSRGELEKIACDEQVMARDLMDRSLEMKEDHQFMDKVAMILEGDEDTLVKISKLVYGEKVDYCGDELFYEADVESARNYVDMFKQAEELIETKKNLEDSINRAEEVLFKEANVGQAIKNVATKTWEKVKGTPEKVTNVGGKIMEKGVPLAERGAFVTDTMFNPKNPDIVKGLRKPRY